MMLVLRVGLGYRGNGRDITKVSGEDGLYLFNRVRVVICGSGFAS
jgi:hypothetical protein